MMTGSIAVKSTKRMFKSAKAKATLGVVIFFLWVIWLLFSSGFSHKVYLKNGEPDPWIILIVAVLVGLLAAWRGPFTTLRNKLLCFVALCLLSLATLWNVPEAWVKFTASQIVESEVTFTIGHPGPPITRTNRCPAGLRFYDAWLNRPIELCTRDALVPPGARTVQLEKRVSARGAIFTHYRFISASGIPQGWWPVNRPDK
ncbi:hypothetical protein [Kosakonia cowanii]|uniref:hypothetical protein n=1 Tax=Kosakonia cowanii TaxID=208223 RepID=UPI002592839E|nr:hypothetical protein [Kosakonia cowanii]MDM9615116.1 hypothetical protein [Kosakonia cowanii]MDP4560531.1 hypothetical protein [Kosakonia cowanii]